MKIIFIDTCRVLWARLPGISYRNEYISFKKAIYHNINPGIVESKNGRYLTLKNNLRENQNENNFVINILNEISKYKNLEINRTKKFLKTFTIKSHNIQTQKLLDKYKTYTRNNNLNFIIKHFKSFNKDINNFFKLKIASKQNVKNLKQFYSNKNYSSIMNTLVSGVEDCRLNL